MSPAMIKYLQENHCLYFGRCRPRNHLCIGEIEEMKAACLLCKQVTLEEKEVK